MKYGEELYTICYWKREVYFYKYRFDPVPLIYKRKRNYFRCWYKTPKTRNETKQSYINKKYVRAKRNHNNLPNSYDDYPRSDSTVKHSWKKHYKCKKQWQKRM